MAAIFGDASRRWEASSSTSAPFCKATWNPGTWVQGAEREAGREGDPTEASRCCCAGFSWQYHRLGAAPSAGWTWPRSF